MAVNRKEDLLASGARSATPADMPLSIRECSGILVVVDLTAFAVAADLRPAIVVPGVGNANFGTLYLADGTHNIVATGTFSYLFYPFGQDGAPAEGGNLKDRVSLCIPEIAELRIVHQNANSHTYSVRVYYLP